MDLDLYSVLVQLKTKIRSVAVDKNRAKASCNEVVWRR